MYSRKKLQKNDDNNVKYAVFEQLLEKGVLQSVQQQMKKAINNELKLIQTNQTKLNNNDNSEHIKSIITDDMGVDSDWKSLTSKIANWEKQIRYELNVEREIQTREIERQKEKIADEWRKVNDRDKTLTIELNGRERIIKQKEDLLKKRTEDIEQKQEEIASKEQTVNEIISEKLKLELKDEIEKLRKKFNELEQTKANLTNREEKLSEAENTLQQQISFVKQNIDNNRAMEMEISRLRHENEIIANENEKLKHCVESMDDYQAIKREKCYLEKELVSIKLTLKQRIIEFETEKEKWENENKSNDEKLLKTQMELRKTNQQIVLLEQKYSHEINEWSYKYEHVVNQLRNSKIALKQLINKNHSLSKELISMQNANEEIMIKTHRKMNTLSQTDASKVGCHICDHNTNFVEESSLDFLASAPKCFTDLKIETQLISEQNEEKLQLLPTKPNQSSNDSKQLINSLHKFQNEGNSSLQLTSTHKEKEIKDKANTREERLSKQKQYSKENALESHQFNDSSLNNNSITKPVGNNEKTDNEVNMIDNRTEFDETNFFDDW